MRKKCFVLSTILLLLFSLPLAAQETSENPYEPFKVDVPSGWKAAYNPGNGKTGQSLKLTSPDGLAIFHVEFEALASGQWQKMIDDMSVRPAPDHGPPNVQSDDTFVVTFNDSATGMTGRKIFNRISPDRYLIQTAYGWHEDLPRLINSVQLELPAEE